GKVVATAPIGSGVDGAGYDGAEGDAFASNADGTLTVIHQDTPDQYHVVQTVQTAAAARNMGLDPTNHRIFLVSAKFGAEPAGGRAWGAVGPRTAAPTAGERGPEAPCSAAWAAASRSGTPLPVVWRPVRTSV